MNPILKTFMAATALLLASNAMAEAESIPLPDDAKLVLFTYNENDTYPIMTMPDNITNIQLNEDEKLIALALGDSVQWITAKTDQQIFIKPSKPNIYTSGTLVTDKRTYQLTLRSSPLGGKWYQRVSWKYPELIVLKQKEEDARKAAEAATLMAMKAEMAKRSAEIMGTSVSKAPGNPVANLNFEYSYVKEGNPEFMPDQTFDDGKFTWIRINKKSQEMPALFIVGPDGGYELVNYVRDGDFLKVNRLFSQAVLKIGKDEVRIRNINYAGIKPESSFHSVASQGGLPWQTKP